MRIWFDTEFIEDGKTIDLISIGLIREDGFTYYAELAEADLSKASEWVQQNVLPHLSGRKKSRSVVSAEIVEFAGWNPEFWGYFAAYDWVALCQLYGGMMQLPKREEWPQFCLDVNQLRRSLGNPELPKQTSIEHNALADAKWTRAAWKCLASMGGLF